MTPDERAALLARYQQEMRRDAWVPGLATEQLPDITRYADPAQREVLIMWHQFDAADAERIVDREVAYFHAAENVTWKIYGGDGPGNLREVLLSRGFKEETDDALMVCATHDLVDKIVPSATRHGPVGHDRTPEAVPEGFARHPEWRVNNIRRLHTKADVARLGEVWQSVWPGEAIAWQDILAHELEAQPERLCIMVAEVGDEPVASGYLVLDPRGNFGYLGGGAVKASHRGAGLYRAVIQARARVASAANIRHLAVEASPESRPILAKLGFTVLTSIRFYSRERPKAPA